MVAPEPHTDAALTNHFTSIQAHDGVDILSWCCCCNHWSGYSLPSTRCTTPHMTKLPANCRAKLRGQACSSYDRAWGQACGSYDGAWGLGLQLI